MAVLTSRRLINIRGQQQKSLPVDRERQRLPALATTLVTDSTVYVGYNAGEWGGWIRAVNRSTGKVTAVAPEFDGPVTGLALEPSGCVAVSMGMVHMTFHSGGLGEICGKQARLVYTKSLRGKETEPFFGISAANDHLWAVGRRSIRVLNCQSSHAVMFNWPHPDGTLGLNSFSPMFNYGGSQ